MALLITLLLIWVAFILITTTRFSLHPFLALLLGALGFGLTSGKAPMEVIDTITTGFGTTLSSIGIIIILGTLIGTFLEKAGGAQAIALGLLRCVGERNIGLAMGAVGYLVGIPVFCDSGFIILSSLNKALSQRTHTTLATGAIALSMGLFASHTMVPPTPGPLAASAIMGANLATVIIFGLIASLFALFASWIFASRFACKTKIQAVTTAEQATKATKLDAAFMQAADPISQQPKLFKALLPILLPILLIILGSIASYPTDPFGTGQLGATFKFLGQPIIALLFGLLAALTLPKRLERHMFNMNGWAGQALTSCANILIITGAGGAFGLMLQTSKLDQIVGESLSLQTTFGILLPFLIAAAIKTAQGSSTVAIITAASIVAPLLTSIGLDGDSQRALAVIAIGAGAMVVSHANDSYFWVVSQFSNMSVAQGYRLQTLGSLVNGLSAMFAVVMISLFI